MEQRITVMVRNRIAEGYRRAGLVLAKGENRLEVTAAELAILQGDHRLKVEIQTAQSEPKAEPKAEPKSKAKKAGEK